MENYPLEIKSIQRLPSPLLTMSMSRLWRKTQNPLRRKNSNVGIVIRRDMPSNVASFIFKGLKKLQDL
jgi:hypothetical protein